MSDRRDCIWDTSGEIKVSAGDGGGNGENSWRWRSIKVGVPRQVFARCAHTVQTTDRQDRVQNAYLPRQFRNSGFAKDSSKLSLKSSTVLPKVQRTAEYFPGACYTETTQCMTV